MKTKPPPPSMLTMMKQELFSKDLILLTWIPVFLITILHYITPSSVHYLHDILRKLYYLPLIYASVKGGIKCGIATAIFISLSYFPHAFMHISHYDPARGIEKILEIILYFGAAFIGGYLSDREKKQKRKVQKVLEEQENLMDQLVRAGRLSALGEVVAGIAHEIKNPLHSLLGTAEIINPLISNDIPERKLWENHLIELKRLKRTSERFLSFARPNSPTMQKTELSIVIDRLLDLIGADARQRGITVEKEINTNHCFVQGDPDQLAQILINIGINALNAMERQGDLLKISINEIEKSDYSMYAINLYNNGPQIPEEEIEHIFDPFHTSSKKGTGLGLSIATRLVRQHSGYIEVENKNSGVNFTIYLPKAV